LGIGAVLDQKDCDPVSQRRLENTFRNQQGYAY